MSLFVDTSIWYAAADSSDASNARVQEVLSQGDPLVTIAVEPHSPYLCAPDLLTEAADIARKQRVPLVIHLSETHSEVTDIQKKGCR